MAEIINNDFKRKSIVYGGNYLAGALFNNLNLSISGPFNRLFGGALDKTLGTHAGSGLANPVGAIIWGGLDVARSAFPKLKESKTFHIIEGLGALYYTSSTIVDLLGVLNGDLGALAQLPFDAAMAYEVGYKNFANDMNNW